MKGNGVRGMKSLEPVKRNERVYAPFSSAKRIADDTQRIILGDGEFSPLAIFLIMKTVYVFG